MHVLVLAVCEHFYKMHLRQSHAVGETFRTAMERDSTPVSHFKPFPNDVITTGPLCHCQGRPGVYCPQASHMDKHLHEQGPKMYPP